MLLFDIFGIGAWITENNPKYANRIIKHLKTFKKANKLDDSYVLIKLPMILDLPMLPQPLLSSKYTLMDISVMPLSSASPQMAWYCQKHLFYNKDFLKSHPEIAVEMKSDSPDKDKSLAESKALIPTLKDFLQNHPLINPKTFLGDAAFDSIEINKYLLQETSFEKAYIPLNIRISLPEAYCPSNENGVPCCPKANSLPMKRKVSKSHRRCGLPTMKFVCPKMKWNMIIQPVKVNVSAIVKILVQNLPAAGCSIFIPRKTCVPIPVQSAVQMNGIPPKKSG